MITQLLRGLFIRPFVEPANPQKQGERVAPVLKKGNGTAPGLVLGTLISKKLERRI
jgi:hypothetical protein